MNKHMTVNKWPAPRVWALLVLVGALMACSDTGVPLSPLEPEARVLAFGNSLTYGTGAPRAQSYPTQLARRIDRTVVNAGIPGETSAQGLMRLEQVLAAQPYDLMILTHGGNDILRNMDMESLKENLSGMIEMAREQGVEVVLVGVPAKNLRLSVPEVYGELAQEYGLALEAEALPDILSNARLKADPIHPNAAGYAELAQRLHRLLQAAGAL